jgi:hypothetical protein
MNDSYLLENLVRVARKMRRCQKAYFAHKGTIKDNRDKKIAYDEAKEAEYQVDKALSQIEKVHPVPED